MEDKELSSLENYVLSSDRPAQLQSFVPGTFLHQYLTFSQLLAAGDLKAIADQNLVSKVIKLCPDNAVRNSINISHALKAIEYATDPENLKKALESFNSTFLHYSFNFSKPMHAQLSSDFEEKRPNTLVPLKLPIEEAHTNFQIFTSLSPELYSRFNIEAMSEDVFKQFVQNIALFEYPSAIPRLAGIIIKGNLFGLLATATLEQLDELLRLNPDLIKHHEFVFAWLSSKYYEIIEIQPDQYRDLLSLYSRMLDGIQDFPASYNGLKTTIRNQLLWIGVELGQFDFKLFEEYLKSPQPNSFYKVRVDLGSVHFFSRFVRIPPKSEDLLLQAYFDELFRTQDDIAPFDQYIEATTLRKFFVKARLHAGVPATEFQDSITPSELQSLIENVEIGFSKTNAKVFERNEEVVVQVVLKNVPRLIVRQYVLNTYAYYLKHNAQIQTNIDLDGLIPSEEQTLDFTVNPLVRSKLDLKVPGLENKAGVFVLELIGNGRSTRAIIKKGSLKCVTMPTSSGTLVKVLDESNTVCKGEGAGIYLDGRFYSTNNSNGQTVLPFAQHTSNKNLILTDGVFSELYEGFTHFNESFELRILPLLPKESAIRGRRAQLKLRTQLLMNGNAASTSLLSGFKLTCIYMSNSGPISSKNITDLVFPEDDKDFLEVDLEIPPKTTSIELSVSTDVQPISKREKVALSWQHSIQLASPHGDPTVYGFFLRNTPEGYLLEVRGKDGNLKDGTEVIVSQTSSYWYGGDNTQVLRAIGGSIPLGHLEDVHLLRVSSNDSSTMASFVIQANHTIVQYPEKINLVEGDEFTIPLERKLKEGEKVVLGKTSAAGTSFELINKYVYNDETQEITLVGLEKGRYFLKLKLTQIEIVVYEGSHWGNNQYILTENSVVHTPNQYGAVCIRDVKVTEDSLAVQFNGDFSSSSVQVYLFNFLTDDNRQITEQISNLSGKGHSSEREFPKAKNVYLDSKQLDEELRYALERKQHEKVMGNTLPRPQLALKRMEIGTTKTETQKASAGTDYAPGMMHNQMRASDMMSRYMMPQASMYAHGIQSVPVFDFLADSSVLVTGLHPNEHGVAELSGLDLSKFSSVQVIASNPGSIAFTVQPLHGAVQTVDLSHKLVFNLSQTYAEQLKCASVPTGDIFTVKDAANQTKVVDTIDKQLRLLVELSRPTRVNLAWTWLGEWDRLPLDKKLEKYDEFVSHELNLFLHAKDPEFFANVVRPFLSEKFEKSFVDKWLLGESLEEYYDSYANLSKQGTKLNALELALLVKAVQPTNPELAGQIAQVIESLAKALPRNEEERRRVYDRILNCEFKEEVPMESAEPFMYQAPPPAQVLMGAKPQMKMMKKSMARSRGAPKAEMMNMMSAPMMEDDFCFDEEKRAPQPKAYYEKLDATKEYAETHYYSIKDLNLFRSLVPFNDFYAELAKSFLAGKDAALSESFIKCISSPTDCYAALAFTDLPFRAARHGFDAHERGYKLTANSNMLIFHKVLDAVEPDLSDSLLVAQKYFDTADRTYTDEDGETVDKPVKQFLKDKIYGCQLILSNTSSKTFVADVLAEIPEGALPVIEQDYTFVKTLTVNPYSTANFEFHFYWPFAGSYRHFPANVSTRGVVRAVARSQTLNVIDKLSLESLESFRDILSSGDTELILRKLQDKNFFTDFNIDDLLWMARDPALYATLINIFRTRRIFDARLWAFSILHSDMESFRELINTRDDIVKALGLYFQSALLNPRSYRHLDYFPLVNARAHKLGTKSKITNTKFREVYRRFLMNLAEKPALEPYDLVSITHYWVLQDRLLEAKQLIDERLADVSGLQLDYIRAYLDLSNSASIAAKYSDYPVKAWKDAFAEVSAQLIEASQQSEYKEANRVDEPNLDFRIEHDGVVKLEYTGLTEATLRIYEVDLEVLFCRNPFFSKGSQDFSFVAPNFKSKIQLDPQTRLASVGLPEKYQNKNVIVEVEYNGNKKTSSHFATSLKVQVLELYGQVKVASQDFMPLPLVYVKAFAKLHSGETQFYKDGYTDIRGRFDFVSLNTDVLKSVQRFALYIEHEQFGSLIVEASPPPQ